MLEHGGRLRAAAQQHHIPVAEWLDLSAAINPLTHPVGDIPADVWQRLPEDDDELVRIATAYYGNELLLPVAGSQAAIQALPSLIGTGLRVGVLQPTYNEHPHAWQRAGHTVVPLLSATDIDARLDTLGVLLLVNPNNPTGATFTADTLLRWHARLQQNSGWLIVDEAFIDADPSQSLVPHAGLPGLVVLRSLGKFFGLAGARVGFAFADAALLTSLREQLGPWPLSHPSRLAAIRALADTGWQQQQRGLLPQQSARLARLLAQNGLAPTGGCALFQWVLTPAATIAHRELAAQGILTRLYHDPASLRFGLPASEPAWQRLALALASLVLPP